MDFEIDPRVRGSFERQGFMRHIGARLLHAKAGRCVMETDWSQDLTQQHGYFHAGVVTTIADSAAGYAAFSLMPPGSSVLSIEFKVNLIAPANGQRLLARGRVIRSARTITVCSMEVEVERDGVRTVCMVGQGTLMCLVGTADRPAG